MKYAVLVVFLLNSGGGLSTFFWTPLIIVHLCQVVSVCVCVCEHPSGVCVCVNSLLVFYLNTLVVLLMNTANSLTHADQPSNTCFVF